MESLHLQAWVALPSSLMDEFLLSSSASSLNQALFETQQIPCPWRNPPADFHSVLQIRTPQTTYVAQTVRGIWHAFLLLHFEYEAMNPPLKNIHVHGTNSGISAVLLLLCLLHSLLIHHLVFCVFTGMAACFTIFHLHQSLAERSSRVGLGVLYSRLHLGRCSLVLNRRPNQEELCLRLPMTSFLYLGTQYDTF